MMIFLTLIRYCVNLRVRKRTTRIEREGEFNLYSKTNSVFIFSIHVTMCKLVWTVSVKVHSLSTITSFRSGALNGICHLLKHLKANIRSARDSKSSLLHVRLIHARSSYCLIKGNCIELLSQVHKKNKCVVN